MGVLAFLRPPGAGKDGVPLKVLFGFERLHVRAGESASVSFSPSLLDFMQVDDYGQHHARAGEYIVEFGLQEGLAHGMGFTARPLVLRRLQPAELAVTV